MLNISLYLKPIIYIIYPIFYNSTYFKPFYHFPSLVVLQRVGRAGIVIGSARERGIEGENVRDGTTACNLGLGYGSAQPSRCIQHSSDVERAGRYAFNIAQ